MRMSALAATGLLAAGLTTASLAEMTIEHAQGTTTLDATPETVVTFDIASLDTLDTLGIDVAGLPQDFVPERLSKYRGDDYTNVGSLFEPDFETLAALQPDLIIVANRSSAAYDDLSKIAPTIDMTVWGAGYLDQLRDRVTTLGEIFSHQNDVAEHLSELDANVEATRELAADAGTALIILTSGGRISAYGPGSRFGWLHDELGVKPVIEDVEAATHGDPVSFEFLLDTNPDYLFVIDRDSAINAGDAARATLDNDLVQQMDAVKNDRVTYLDSVNWYIVMSGLTATSEMVNEVKTALER
ncbi:siderophore ABC transporter substrate-binding protein [Saccharospirillum sp. MSK14-1]|uniref:siderophore ABC transporter substrate-binding protein n=1 Tax=Saccharospirillum sp. MSK14-1 TaxID=1897632 RepID=UPI001E297397|nr:siderophore ABC transporter substrate-binding protein [Saccharospirillum sp. MSK14-1]